jgi:hypothetical protein
MMTLHMMVQVPVSFSFSAISCSHGEEACGHSVLLHTLVQLEATAMQVECNQMFTASTQSDGHIPANTSLCLTPPIGTTLANPCMTDILTKLSMHNLPND